MKRVPAGRWPQFSAMLCVLLGPSADAHADLEHLQSDESTEIAYLIRRGTADCLATAWAALPLMIVELVQSAFCSVDETTYLGRLFSRAATPISLLCWADQ